MTGIKLTFACWLLVLPIVSHAYIGPGLGLGAIGVGLGILGAILLCFFAILWYPFKRLLNSLRKKKEDKQFADKVY